jgi:hypothetical protein
VWRMPEPYDPYQSWPLVERLQMLAFEAELGRLPRSLIATIWEAMDSLDLPRGSGAGLAVTSKSPDEEVLAPET